MPGRKRKRMRELEKDIEKYFVNEVGKRNGLCWKFTSPGRRGVPDRWCACKGHQFFAELKRPHHAKRADEKLQKAVHERMAKEKVKVYVLESRHDIDLLMRYLDRGMLPEVNHFAKL